MLELYVFPLNRVNDPLQPDLPGLVAMPPVKPGSRGREGDLLILYISLSRPGAFTSIALKQMLQNAADLYRRGHGTVTAGLRAIADQLNGLLLAYNLRAAEKNEPVLATLNLLALRESLVYIAQSGATHTFVINAQAATDYSEALTGGRGLGFASTLNMKYYQVSAGPGDVLVFSPNPPEIWTPEALAGSNQLTLEHLRRRLANHTGPELQAVVIKFQLGKGQIHVLRPRSGQAIPGPAQPAAPGAVPAAPPAAEDSAPAAPPPAGEETRPSPPPLDQTAPEPPPPGLAATQPLPVPPPDATAPLPAHPAGPGPAAPPEKPAGVPLTRAERRRQEWARTGRPPATTPPAAPPPAPTAGIQAEEKAPPAAPPPPRRRGQGRRQAASGWLGIKSFFRRIGFALNSVTSRVFPPSEEKKPPLPAAVMLFIAIAIPLMVVAVAATVYLESGKAEQRLAYYQKAVEFAEAAIQPQDLAQQTNNWIQAQSWLDKAEERGATPQTSALRKRIQEALDKNDGITRLDFRPINRYGFSAGTKITRMVANSSDIYLLDSAQGKVSRLFLTGTGYETDNQFNCKPGQYGGLQVGPLVDLVILPPNLAKTAVLAMDASATLLYCGPGLPPSAVQLQMPESGMNEVLAMALYQDNLVILDPKNNAVWLYAGQDTSFADAPELFFDTVIPPLGNVIDLAYYGDDLYLMRGDGSMTQCTAPAASFAPTRCKDPAYYGDAQRPGRDPLPVNFPEAVFSHLIATPPPDPSLYILDTKGQGVYHFSLLLNFQRQLRPSYAGDPRPPREAPTAFTVTPSRLMIMAYGSQVFYAQLP